jgi:hypothetical protein
LQHNARPSAYCLPSWTVEHLHWGVTSRTRIIIDPLLYSLQCWGGWSVSQRRQDV